MQMCVLFYWLYDTYRVVCMIVKMHGYGKGWFIIQRMIMLMYANIDSNKYFLSIQKSVHLSFILA